ncbi:hypothetical protein B0H16DRAFT_1663802 [Mycena metata]|uniref:Uncharacterized protein n=1 Tax=Mycena metata TaxID=1033252 RepID=A0AAD7N6P6_9AGAR|nr:hypothetical protein B0H16DRAFT_1663802 [Mycena metata]
MLGGFPPNAPDWQEAVVAPAARAMEVAAQEIYQGAKRKKKAKADAANPPRRGTHAAESVGVDGGGQPYPMMLCHSITNLAVFAGLFGLKCFERISGWTNVLFMAFTPDLHEYYCSTVNSLYEWDASQQRAKHLKRNFRAVFSVFTTATFNFGPITVTFPHIDFGNLAILIPSAILRHSNVKIQPGEHRYLFTQFTPAGIFRWDINTAASTSPQERARRQADRAVRWQEGVKMCTIWEATGGH